jgi:TATA-box binding protein (TBP) (component of TFIID and TFIIIB)
MSKKFTPLKIVNVVLTAKLGVPYTCADTDEVYACGGNITQNFDLAKIALIIEDASVEYFPRRFAALKLCRPEPFSKALFFRSGKIVCVGNRSEEGGREAVEWFCKRVAKAAQIQMSIVDVSVQNIVATSMLVDKQMRIRLKRASILFSTNTQYEPELFPGCAFRFGETWKQVVNVFTSGKIVLTGVKNTRQLIQLAEMFLALVKPKSNDIFMTV